MDGEQSVCLSIVAKVAEYEGTAPEDLQPPLHSAIDTDSLDALFEAADSDREGPSVEFTYKGYTIRVDGADEITINDPTRDSRPQAGKV